MTVCFFIILIVAWGEGLDQLPVFGRGRDATLSGKRHTSFYLPNDATYPLPPPPLIFWNH